MKGSALAEPLLYKKEGMMAKKEKEPKTNAVRIVAAKKIPLYAAYLRRTGRFSGRRFCCSRQVRTPDSVFKTLVLASHSKRIMSA